MSCIAPEPGGIEWIDDPISDDVDGEGKSSSDGKENKGTIDDRVWATVINPTYLDSRIFEHAIGACFDRAGWNTTVPVQYSPFPRLQQDVGEPPNRPGRGCPSCIVANASSFTMRTNLLIRRVVVQCTRLLPLLLTGARIVMLGTGLARAEDMEPRSYSASPIDTNFLIGSYQRTTGDVALDADLPISDVKAAINTGILAYNRTFDLFGHTGSVAIVLPYFQGNLSGNVGSESKQITREGFGDRLSLDREFNR